MKVSELNAAMARESASKEHKTLEEERPSEGREEKIAPWPGTEEVPASLRLQYEYELERGREISSSVSRLTVLIPLMMAAACLLVWMTTTYCAQGIPARIFIILGATDMIALLCALAVTCTVHFYILNPAPPQTGEETWLFQMKRDLQRGNNWRGWLVFAATILIYVSVGITLALLVLALIGL